MGPSLELTEAVQEATRTSDVLRLHDMGVHQYLISQSLRLTFGTRAASNTHPAMDAFKKAMDEQTGKFRLSPRKRPRTQAESAEGEGPVGS